jgi:predicted TPR repeat methyltransferase
MAETAAQHAQESSEAFHGVFTAASPSALERVYDSWASTYDDTIAQELAGDGVNHPTTELIEVVKSALPPSADVRRVLDCGAGTGAAGPLLMDAYGPLDALVAFDLSARMLERAGARGCYTELVRGCCPDMSVVAGRAYDLVVCAGTFTPNHAPPTTLAALVPLVCRGGHIAFSVRSYFYADEASGFMAAQRALELDGSWLKVIEEERVYLPKEDVMALYFVYERL